MNSLDYCPTCQRRIGDFDSDGCESPATAQRYCLAHLPAWETINFILTWAEDFNNPDVFAPGRD